MLEVAVLTPRRNKHRNVIDSLVSNERQDIEMCRGFLDHRLSVRARAETTDLALIERLNTFDDRKYSVSNC